MWACFGITYCLEMVDFEKVNVYVGEELPIIQSNLITCFLFCVFRTVSRINPSNLSKQEQVTHPERDKIEFWIGCVMHGECQNHSEFINMHGKGYKNYPSAMDLKFVI
jgi:hypothetical protein